MKLDAMPQREIVLGYKGTLDFYSWKGIAVVRSWPRKPSGPRSPAVQAQARKFSYIIHLYSQQTAAAKAAAQGSAVGTLFAPRDAFVSAYYGKALTNTNNETIIDYTGA